MHMMGDCPECGVPEYVVDEHAWLNNGDIVHSRDHSRRLAFIESENIDPILHEVERRIGASIERIVIACVQENVRRPMSLFVSDELRERARRKEEDYRSFFDTAAAISRNMGRGSLELLDMRYERDDDDFYIFRISEPFSIPLNCGARAAGLEAVLGYAHGVRYEKVSPEVYDITVFPSPHRREFEGRPMLEGYRHQEGDIVLERCGTCGIPKALSSYRWYPERGIILREPSKQRMVTIAPHELDPVFQELENELGETIPRLIVDAQRHFADTGFYAVGDIRDERNLRAQLALRGLGNLKDLKVNERGLEMRLENTTLHLMIVGMMQGLFDMAYDTDSSVDWEYSEDTGLGIKIIAG